MVGKVESEISNSAYSRCIIPAYWPLGTALKTSVFQRLCQLRNPAPWDGGWKQTVTFLRTQLTEDMGGKASLSRQADKVADKWSKGCKVCTKEPPGSGNSPGRSDGQDCLFQGIYEEPVLHLNQLTAHSRAACSLSKNSHHSRPSHTSTAAQQTLSSRVTPMHTVSEGRWQLFTLIQEAIFFFPTCCNWVNWQLEMTTCNPLLLQIQ